MNFIVKSVLAGSLMLAFAGCKTEFDGTTTVHQKISVKLKKGYGNLNAGTYASTMKFSSKKKATLEVETRGDKMELPIAIPKNSLPQDNGPISWKAEEINQTFDVEGSLRTQVTDSSVRRGTESCTGQVPTQECYYDPQGRPYCRDGYRTVTGVRDIEYFDRQFDRVVNLELRNPKSGVVQGKIAGKNLETERVVTRQSHCRVYSSLRERYGNPLNLGPGFIF